MFGQPIAQPEEFTEKKWSYGWANNSSITQTNNLKHGYLPVQIMMAPLTKFTSSICLHVFR